MAGVTPQVHTLVTARLDLVQVNFDVVHHAHHFASPVLVGVLIGGKVVGTEGFAFLALGDNMNSERRALL